MKAKGSPTATLADVKLVLTAPSADPTRRKGYQAAQMAFLQAKDAFTHRATSTTWAATVEKARKLHTEWQRIHEARFGPERQERATLAVPDEGGEA